MAKDSKHQSDEGNAITKKYKSSLGCGLVNMGDAQSSSVSLLRQKFYELWYRIDIM